MFSVADFGLASLAVKVTSISHVLPAATVWPLHLSVGFANDVGFAPVNDTPVIVSGALPVLCTMIACGLLVVPTAVLKPVGPVMLTAGWVPVAVRFTGDVPLTSGSLVEICSVP